MVRIASTSASAQAGRGISSNSGMLQRTARLQTASPRAVLGARGNLRLGLAFVGFHAHGNGAHTVANVSGNGEGIIASAVGEHIPAVDVLLILDLVTGIARFDVNLVHSQVRVATVGDREADGTLVDASCV